MTVAPTAAAASGSGVVETAARASASMPTPISCPGAAGALLPQAGTVAIHASSRLWGAEANLRTNLCRDCCYRVDLIGGFRFLSLEERLNISETEVPLAPGSFEFSSLTDSFSTQNRFY